MKTLNITKEQFEKSRYFTDKYGKLAFVSESGKLFKTSKGKLLKFKESVENEGTEEKLDNPAALIKFIRGLPDGDEYLFQDGGKWIATNEWLCGTFAGNGFEGNTEEEAVQKLIDYLNLHIGHNSIVGQNVTKSGWPIASKVSEYVAPEEEEVDESATPLNGDQETETLVKVNDIVEKAYAKLYDELKKAGIDFDSTSDDGFYVNDPDAQKTYFINLYVKECEEYEGSYMADESKKNSERI